jgi:hypothetical protein
MKINDTLRKRLKPLLPSNYRQVVVERLKNRGITVHPNTVQNALAGKGENPAVVLELLKLGNEMKQSQQQFDLLAMQLSQGEFSQTDRLKPGTDRRTIKSA